MRQTGPNNRCFPTLSALFPVLFAGLFVSPGSGAGSAPGIRLDSPARSFQAGLWGMMDQDWDDWDDDWGDWKDGKRSSVFTRYNRVEGFTAGMRVSRDEGRARHPQRPFLYGHWGYAFAAGELQYQIGIEKGFFETYRFGFGGEYRRMIDTPDRWLMPETENSLAAFLLKEDFHDFYLSEGGSGYVVQNLTKAVTLHAAYHTEKFQAVEKNTNWSLFGGGKRFRENPAVGPGEMRGFSASLAVDTRNSKKVPTRGWYLQIEGERMGDDFGGDFTYDRVWGDLRRYQPLGFHDGIDIRLRAGTANGDPPWPKRFYLGGPGTLRGYRYKAFPDTWSRPGGNRMLLAQVEYRLGKQIFPDDFAFFFLEHFDIILFADAGWTDTVDSGLDLLDGFDDITYRDIRSDAGLALASHSGNFRIEIARRTDTGVKPFMFWVRLNRAF